MITENLSTLKIHKLTQEQYDRALAAGTLEDNALYLTPDDDSNQYATVEQLNEKADKTLRVTLSENDGVYTANYKASEIIEHINNGGDTLLIYEGLALPLVGTINGVVIYHNVTTFLSVDYLFESTTVIVYEDSAEVEAKSYEDPLSAGFIKGETVASIYETKNDASGKLSEAKSYAKTYTDNALSNKADSSHSHNDIYYTKTEIDNLELVSIDDIDTICGATIQVASVSEVTF